jgi:hypothetical protein
VPDGTYRGLSLLISARSVCLVTDAEIRTPSRPQIQALNSSRFAREIA